MKQLTCNICYDEEVGPVEAICTLLNVVDSPFKKGVKVAIIKEESEECGEKYTLWDYKDWKKLERYHEKENC